ncbi:hypothetical protein ACFY0G_17455 [Streptomyces sp. NPDC001552]|uniref:hypothetical protein n=1 Tax=Streptomyces sp. NPDC001552 TaxID=3364587 RepID=UPI0036791990
MTPEQASARAALVLIHRLIQNRGLTVEEAVVAVAQRRRREVGPHTDLVTAEAAAVLHEAFAPIRAMMEAFKPVAQAMATAMADLVRALQRPAIQGAATARASRPAWASPYGPPPRRRFP